MRTNQCAVALASALLTAGFLLLTGRDWPGSECHVLSEWWSARQSGALYENASLQSHVTDPLALRQLGAITFSALKEAGWRSGVKFARFGTCLRRA
jgi:hypothetical protein